VQHSVVQSSFGAPCVKSLNTTTGDALFSTGFQNIGNTTNFVTSQCRSLPSLPASR
jgi:hypothetical protein